MQKSIFKSTEGRNIVLNGYKNFLEKWPVSKEIVNVNTKFGNTNVIISGKENKKSIFLLHGTSSNSLVWSSYVKQLAKDFKVYAIDIPGEPGMSSENQFDVNSSVSVKWLDSIKDYFDIKKFSLLGYSLGGYISLKYSIEKGTNVEKLGLISTSGIGKQNTGFIFFVISMMFAGDYGINKIIDKINYKVKLDDESYKYSFQVAKHFKPRIINIKLLEKKELEKLNMPVYIVMGEKDALINSRLTYENAKKSIHNLKFDFLKDVGHLVIDKEDDMYKFFTDEQ